MTGAKRLNRVRRRPRLAAQAHQHPDPLFLQGIQSYGYTDAAVKTQGSSILNDTFVALMDGACGHRAGNCP